MSSESDLQSALEFIQMDNYVSRMFTPKSSRCSFLYTNAVVVVTAIVYDYGEWRSSARHCFEVIVATFIDSPQLLRGGIFLLFSPTLASLLTVNLKG